MHMTLDRIDGKILQALDSDARMSVSQIGGRVGLSQSACSRRIQALEEAGALAGYAPRYGWKALGFNVVAYVSITLASQAEASLLAFEQAASKIVGVVECALVSGDHDYQLKIIARDLEDYERIHREGLGQLPGVARISTSFVLRAIPAQGEAAIIAP